MWKVERVEEVEKVEGVERVEKVEGLNHSGIQHSALCIGVAARLERLEGGERDLEAAVGDADADAGLVVAVVVGAAGDEEPELAREPDVFLDLVRRVAGVNWVSASPLRRPLLSRARSVSWWTNCFCLSPSCSSST